MLCLRITRERAGFERQPIGNYKSSSTVESRVRKPGFEKPTHGLSGRSSRMEAPRRMYLADVKRATPLNSIEWNAPRLIKSLVEASHPHIGANLIHRTYPRVVYHARYLPRSVSGTKTPLSSLFSYKFDRRGSLFFYTELTDRPFPLPSFSLLSPLFFPLFLSFFFFILRQFLVNDFSLVPLWS